MPRTIYQVLEFNPKKHHIHLTKKQIKCFTLLKKGIIFEPKKIINDNLDYLTPADSTNKLYTRTCVFDTLKIARGLGLVKEVHSEPISFQDFCELESVSYFADQLRGNKNKNLKDNGKLVSTKEMIIFTGVGNLIIDYTVNHLNSNKQNISLIHNLK